jgi:hypothetical protein
MRSKSKFIISSLLTCDPPTKDDLEARGEFFAPLNSKRRANVSLGLSISPVMVLEISGTFLKKPALASPVQENLRCYSEEVLDVMCKMTLIGEADLMRDFTDGELTRRQQFFCFLCSRLDDIPVW